jgi:hypothetical protein
MDDLEAPAGFASQDAQAANMFIGYTQNSMAAHNSPPNQSRSADSMWMRGSITRRLRGCAFINGDVFMHPSAYVGPADPNTWFSSLEVGDEVEFVAKFHVEGRNNWRVVRVRDISDTASLLRQRRALASSCPDPYAQQHPMSYDRRVRVVGSDLVDTSKRSIHQQMGERHVFSPLLSSSFDMTETHWDPSLLDLELRAASAAVSRSSSGLEKSSTTHSSTSSASTAMQSLDSEGRDAFNFPESYSSLRSFSSPLLAKEPVELKSKLEADLSDFSLEFLGLNFLDQPL